MDPTGFSAERARPPILDFKALPLSKEKINSDLVMCLALVHHLVFFGKLTLEQIFEIL